ncbi:hypothetical protein OIV83_004596 [Microbotryomycetes sp. JL201]|nr:hypothetical protein OIV83_004596 [Microbotryomycetes sp. JL201]
MVPPSSSSSSSFSSPRHIVIGGIETSVFGLDLLDNSSNGNASARGLAVLFFLHGRFGSVADQRTRKWCDEFVARAHAAKDSPHGRHAKDLVVVAFDQRNHGKRTVDATRNKGWKDDPKHNSNELDNPAHAVDMVSIQTGTARDVSLLIDFFEAATWPNGERTVTDWYCGGVSLGGHATWIALAHEPRLSLGIPIIGSPDTVALLSNRARRLPPPLGPLAFSSPHVPDTFQKFLARNDPINVSLDTWRGRKVCVLSGKDDELVNYDVGGTAAFVERLQQPDVLGRDGVIDVWVQDGVGHAYSAEMAERASDFLWRHGLSSAYSEPDRDSTAKI